jgi:hypothetical protein
MQQLHSMLTILRQRGPRLFTLSASVVLALTGLAKIYSGFGKAHLLEVADPIFGTAFRVTMVSTGSLELVVAVVCLLDTRLSAAPALVTLLGSSFLIYRAGLHWTGWHKPCNCLGTLTDSIGLSPDIADFLLKTISAYLFVGGYILLLSRPVRLGAQNK